MTLEKKFDIFQIGMTDLEEFLNTRILEGRGKAFPQIFERKEKSLTMAYNVNGQQFQLVVTKKTATIHHIVVSPRGAMRRSGISGEYDLPWQAYLAESIGRPYAAALFFQD